jgi:NAD+ kinase
MSVRDVSVLTHTHPMQTASALEAVVEAAVKAGVTLRFDRNETDKHKLAGRDGLVVGVPDDDIVDLCVVLGGDGTILRGLRRYAGTGVPVFAVNFGEVGFLATIDPDPEELEPGLDRALAGEFEVLRLPALALATPTGRQLAINDLAVHRRAGERVAQLAYAVGGEEVGSVRADGLVVATPAGSTGYNLANGGPVLAWGVEGFGVSFIAPHSLTARALVVAPGDELSVHNRSEAPVDITVDGGPGGLLAPGQALTAAFERDAACLAQVSGSSFYRRLREKFGRLAS